MSNLRYTHLGFTLIELLVVISLITLVSSVLIGNVRTAQIKSANTLTTTSVVSYKNALSTYAIEHPAYPSLLPLNQLYCLGNPPPGEVSCIYALCFGWPSPFCNTTIVPVSSAFIIALTPYLNSLENPQPTTVEVAKGAL